MGLLSALLLTTAVGFANSSPTVGCRVPSPAADVWQPEAGTSWEIVLLKSVNIDVSAPSLIGNVDVLDFDLFTNTANGTDSSKIDALHGIGKKVICYFSAGSYEDGRPDSGQFTAADKGAELIGWPGEFWLDLKSDNVAKIARNRIAIAAEMGCDAVDPDNMDAYVSLHC